MNRQTRIDDSTQWWCHLVKDEAFIVVDETFLVFDETFVKDKEGLVNDNQGLVFDEGPMPAARSYELCHLFFFVSTLACVLQSIADAATLAHNNNNNRGRLQRIQYHARKWRPVPRTKCSLRTVVHMWTTKRLACIQARYD